MKKILTLFIFFLVIYSAKGQYIFGTNTAHPNAILTIQSADSSKLIKLPAVTTANLATLGTGPSMRGLLAFDITDSCIKLYNGVNWDCMTQDSAAEWVDMGTHIISRRASLNGDTVIISNNGRIGVGLDSNLLGSIHISNDGSNRFVIMADNYGQTTQTRIRRANGTKDSPLPLDSGNTIGNYSFNGYGHSKYGERASVAFLATTEEDFSDTTKGAGVSFFTTPVGDTLSLERIRISANGNIGIGRAIPNSDALLHLYSQDSSQGMIVPFMTNANLPAAGNTNTGMLVYNTDDSCFQVSDGVIWDCISTRNDSASEWFDGASIGFAGTIFAKQTADAGDTVVITDVGDLGLGVATPYRGIHLKDEGAAEATTKNRILIEQTGLNNIAPGIEFVNPDITPDSAFKLIARDAGLTIQFARLDDNNGNILRVDTAGNLKMLRDNKGVTFSDNQNFIKHGEDISGASSVFIGARRGVYVIGETDGGSSAAKPIFQIGLDGNSDSLDGKASYLNYFNVYQNGIASLGDSTGRTEHEFRVHGDTITNYITLKTDASTPSIEWEGDGNLEINSKLQTVLDIDTLGNVTPGLNNSALLGSSSKEWLRIYGKNADIEDTLFIKDAVRLYGTNSINNSPDIWMKSSGIITTEDNFIISSNADADGTGDIIFGSDSSVNGSITRHMNIKPSGQIGIGTESPNTDALVHMYSQDSSQGMIIPFMTNANRPVAGSSNNGMMMYNTDDSCFQISNGVFWDCLKTQNDTSTEWFDGNSIGLSNRIFAKQTADAGDTVVITDAGDLGLGVATPFRGIHLADAGSSEADTKNRLLLEQSGLSANAPGVEFLNPDITPDSVYKLIARDAGLTFHFGKIDVNEGALTRIDTAGNLKMLRGNRGVTFNDNQNFIKHGVSTFTGSSVFIGSKKNVFIIGETDGGSNGDPILQVGMNGSSDSLDSQSTYRNFFNIRGNGVASLGDSSGQTEHEFKVHGDTITDYISMRHSGSHAFVDWEGDGDLRFKSYLHTTTRIDTVGNLYPHINDSALLGKSSRRWRIIFGDSANFSAGVKADAFVSSTTTYPDYVFEEFFDGNSEIKADYSFKSLSEVEKFIAKNKHLPGVKSIEEVTNEDGEISIDLGETSIKNLEKIEELFIHTINLSNENKRQQEVIEQLQKESAELKKKDKEIKSLRKENEQMRADIEAIKKMLRNKK